MYKMVKSDSGVKRQKRHMVILKLPCNLLKRIVDKSERSSLN